MQNNILFFQSTSIGGTENNPGLFELLLAHLDNLELGIFEQLQIIVPNLAIATWLKDQIAVKKGVFANLDCVVLPGPVLDNIYYANNPEFEPFNFNEAKSIIYQYLCNTKLDNAIELNNYIYVNGILDKFRTYQLSSQLQKIFHEYIYLRTEDLINLEQSKIKPWQKEIIRHLFSQIGERKTFLDVYQYFMSVSLSEIRLPQNIMLFGLTSIYPSQLLILSRLSNSITLYWYHQSSSYKYYGDLLSDRTKSKLEQKLLRKPDLSLDDLYLQDGNPLLANLAQQSREFTELLIANDINVYTFAQDKPRNPQTILQIIQEDIKNMLYRIEPDYRFGSNLEAYADSLDLSHYLIDDKLYDLANRQTSIKINVCHNRMREVQVMFNELVNMLNNEPETKLSEILITAPDIDDYAAYIKAVFDNESINAERLLYNITGNRKYKNIQVFEILKMLLNAPYSLTVNYFIEVLTRSQIQDNFDISLADVDLVKKWLYDNNTHFGYDKEDYRALGYTNYQIHSFKQFINNIVLGACISSNVWQGDLPVFTAQTNDDTYIPYDNLDNNQVKLCNSLIILLEQLELLRDKFYLDANSYKELSISEIHEILTSLNEILLNDKNTINNFERFLGELLNLPEDLIITLPILELMLDEYIEDFSSNLSFNGSITCASMRYMRNLPYKKVYILGLNFGEYPNSYTPNQLSLLANDWYLADRNYNIEDKQTFLDIILACGEQLYLSYIGKRETDNSEIKPATVLSLLINTLGQSVTNFKIHSNNNGSNLACDVKYDFKNLLVYQSLHPFYNNKQLNYSYLWSKIANLENDYINKAWDFTRISPLKIDVSRYSQLKIDNIIKMFFYSNANLYNVLGIRQLSQEAELSDVENITLHDKSIAREVEKYFKKYANSNNTPKQLEEYLIANGTLGYAHIGQVQFNYYYELYNKYTALSGSIKARLSFSYTINEDILLTIEDDVYLEYNSVIVTDSFAQINKDDLVNEVESLDYSLKMKGLLVYLLCFGGATITAGDRAYIIEQVIIRQISKSGDSCDFILSVGDVANVLKQVLRYYVRSLSNPVLIHKSAIVEFAKLSRMNKPYNICISGAKAKYAADFENNDLDKIRDDIIFRSIADNYFEFIESINGINDIVKIGEILSRLNP